MGEDGGGGGRTREDWEDGEDGGVRECVVFELNRGQPKGRPVARRASTT